MSDSKSQSLRSVLGTIRAAQIVEFKPFLPAGNVTWPLLQIYLVDDARDHNLDSPILAPFGPYTLGTYFQATPRHCLRRYTMGTTFTGNGVLGRGGSKSPRCKVCR